MNIKLDVAKLFMDGRQSELIELDVPTRSDGQPEFGTTIEVDGAKFEYGNIDRSRSGYDVPRDFPTDDYYPHWIEPEGFWHPANDVAESAVARI